jgi:hypothetical protein
MENDGVILSIVAACILSSALCIGKWVRDQRKEMTVPLVAVRVDEVHANPPTYLGGVAIGSIREESNFTV